MIINLRSSFYWEKLNVKILFAIRRHLFIQIGIKNSMKLLKEGEIFFAENLGLKKRGK